MDYNMNGNYGVSKGVRARIKLGFIYIVDLLGVGVIFMLGVQGAKLFPPDQALNQLIYWILLVVLALYTMIKPHDSYHKNTYMLLAVVNRRAKRYHSMNRYEEL
ncbi:hypothetical protein [Furfurilactobacillus entadae]|uniref:hypothetical protein n=1 Tax=Furfurilactobacillus entadae TaxID=2922307 RepID=UPI0035EF18CB